MARSAVMRRFARMALATGPVSHIQRIRRINPRFRPVRSSPFPRSHTAQPPKQAHATDNDDHGKRQENAPPDRATPLTTVAFVCWIRRGQSFDPPTDGRGLLP